MPNSPATQLLLEWTGPYGGVPPFDRVTPADFPPAIEAAMAASLAALDRIAADPAPPTFANTIEAMQRASRALDRVEAVYDVWSSNVKTPAFCDVETEMEPKLAAYRDRVTQNERLFARVEAVHRSPETASLTREQQRLVWLTWSAMVRAGAKLDAPAKARVAAINQRLAALFTQFGQNLLADEEKYVLWLEEGDLAGLPPSVRDAAAAAAEQRGRKGAWAITNTRSSMEPFLTYAERRDLREKVWRTYYGRGDNRDANDNTTIIPEILALRAERAKLLGYPTHAHWRLEHSMAKTPDEAMRLMMQVWPAAVARAEAEIADMQALAGFAIEPWDYRFYAEKVRKARYDLDMDEAKPFLELGSLRDAMFWVAERLYGLSFTEARGVPVHHPSVTVYEVTARGGGGGGGDKANGDVARRHVGLWYFDPYARPGKGSGAWMTAYRAQERLDGEVSPLVSNNANFVARAPGERVLVSWDEATTMFHEFGHALHALCSNVRYGALAGTAVFRDYVELPSQLHEHWLATPEVLGRFARDAAGRPMPQALVDKIARAETFNQGFAVTEYLSAAIVDMKLHLAAGADGAAPIDVRAFERDTLAALGMPKAVVMRHRTPQFGHVFSGDGYSAGYYSYLWAEVLAHDAYEAFVEAGGPFDAAVAARLYERVMSVGNTVDPAEGYRAFRGRGPDVRAYLRAKGFPVDAANG